MKKITVILILLSFFIIFSLPIFAIDFNTTSINMFIDENNIFESTSVITNTYPNPANTISTQNNNEFVLTPDNIISIILIAVGLVIIFLAIAILIRCNH